MLTMITLDNSISIIPGIGEVTEINIDRLGIRTLRDLLSWYPREYLDASQPVLIKRAPYDRLIAIEVEIERCEVRRTKNRHLSMLEAVCSDDSGSLTVRWFNQPFLKQKLLPGTRWILIGNLVRFKGMNVMMSPLIESQPTILAVYAQTKGVTSKMLRNFIGWALEHVSFEHEDIPAPILQQEGQPTRQELLRMIHQPVHMEEVERARQGLAFEEVFWFFVRMSVARSQAIRSKGVVIPADVSWLQEVVGQLPFDLTPGQKRAIWDSVQEMAQGHAMTRLLNGDVGTGKTVVAAVLAAAMAKAGYQTMMLVPTEVLARQHAISLEKFLSGLSLSVGIWTASQKKGQEADVLVGTHALLQESVSLERLGLVIVDEQHRFGVKQRQALRSRPGITPHLLSMTATPIPRTLALALYGDLAVSFLPDKPKDRLPIKTAVVHEPQRSAMYKMMASEIKDGHQVFVICPLIEEKEKPKEKKEAGEGTNISLMSEEELKGQEKKTVMAEAERLRKEHPELGVIEVLHGKMKPADKAAIMARMATGEVDVLVATSVIEVGVDVPNATVMVIEGAERFGLAQLHQFRGRVGRGSAQSYCYLCPSLRGAAIDERLRLLAQTDNGFEVAEVDLQLRGPGELVGDVQSGLPDFRMASLTDVSFLQRVKSIVDEEIQKNPDFLKNYTNVAYSNERVGLE